MVATRRGVRVNSQNTEQNEPSVSTATPATRATRRRAVREELTSDSQRKGGEGGSTAASPEIKGSTAKRKSRSSKRQLRNEDQPDSMHEADVSESESCCSAVSGLQAPADAQGPRRRRRGALPSQKTSSGMDQDVHSEAESCCSSASAQQGSSIRRATRSRQMSTPMEGRPVKLANANNENSEAESCSSAVSGTKVLTRSQKRITLSRASSKSRTEDTEISEVDSCSSSVSGLQQSTLRKSARSRRGRAVQPVPLCLEENADGSPWPRRQTRGSRVKLESAKDSEGFESGPSATPRRSTRGQTASTHQGQLILSDSESEATDVCSPVGSPSSLRGKGTPCSSRTGSGSSARALVVPPITPKALNVLKEQGDGEASASSDQRVSDLPKNQEEERTESGTADGLLDSASQPETVTETAEPKAKEAVAMVADSHVSLECSLTEEVSEDDKTLIAEGEECVCAAPVTMDDKAEPQMVEDAAQVNLCESGRLTSKDDTVAPGMFEEKANKDEQLHMTEDVVPPSPAVKVIVSCAAVSEGKEVEDGAMETDSTVATVCEKLQGVCEKDNSLAEESDGVTVEVAESTELHIEQKAGHSLSLTDSTVATVCEKLQGVCEKDNSLAEESDGVTVEVAEDTEPHIEPKAGHSLSLTLLDSSDEEAENSDSGHSGRESGDEKDSEGSDMDTEIMCVDENLAGPSKPQAASPVMANDGLFVIDTLPGCHSDGKYYLDQEKMGEDKGVVGEQCDDIEDEQDEEFVDEEGDEDEDAEDSFLFKSKSKDPVKLSTSIDPGLKVKDIGGLYISVNGIKSKGTSNAMKKSKEQKDHERLMQKCVIGPDFEKKDSVPPYKESKQAMKLKRKEEKEKTTGDGWFNMKAPEMTEELTNDLKVLKMRAAMDPKRFYKKNDRDGFPKYFQVGTVVDSPVDFYHSRIPKKQRKRTMVEELLADAEFRNYNKKKYKQIMAEKAALAAGKKNRKKNKFCKKQGI